MHARIWGRLNIPPHRYSGQGSNMRLYSIPQESYFLACCKIYAQERNDEAKNLHWRNQAVQCYCSAMRKEQYEIRR